MLRLLLHLDKALLAGASALLIAAVAGPLPHAGALSALERGDEPAWRVVDTHFQEGAATAAPRRLTALETAAQRLNHAPPAPEPLPAWCAERRPAWLYQVEQRERRVPRAEPPRALSAAQEGAGVRLRWEPGENDLVSVRYLVERRVGDGAWEALGAPQEGTELLDPQPPPRRPLGYRVVALAERASGLEEEAEPLPAEQARLTCELEAPLEVRRLVEVRLRDVWVPPELSREQGWASLDVVRLAASGAELSRRGLPRVAVGQPIGDSGAVLLEVDLPLLPSRFGGEVPTPRARVRWPEGDLEELQAAR